MNKLHLMLLSTAFFVPSLSAQGFRFLGRHLGRHLVARSQPIGPRNPAQSARETRAGNIPAATIPKSHQSRETRTFPLCSPTTRENPIPPQNFEQYKSRHGTFAYFIATVKVKESLGGENRTRERIIVFYDNGGANKVMEIANELMAECQRVLDATISWQLVEYDTPDDESLDNLD